MKKSIRSSARKRNHTSLANKKQSVQRPFPKRVLLHPFSVMVLLCVGVLLAGSTFQGFAASYDVTAAITNARPTTPAVITQPYSQQHYSNSPILVLGTCPEGTYVKLYRSLAFSGVAQCIGQTFQIQTDLAPGSNQLEAKVYNTTNQEGPGSAPVTVYYDETNITPQVPLLVPTTLEVNNVEEDTFQQGVVSQTSVNPTVTGIAPPYADVEVIFHSEVSICKTKADGSGWWICTLDHTLPAGVHQVDVTATTTSGEKLTFPPFHIKVTPGLPSLLQKRKGIMFLSTEYQFQTHYVGQAFTWTVGISGGTAPYNVTIDWGDDSQSHIIRSDRSIFSIEHAYPSVKTYTIFIKSTDAKGLSTTLQLSAFVKGPVIGAASLRQSPLNALLYSLGRYMWVVWPVYIAVVLMVISYWLGEQEVYQRLRKRHLAHAGKGR